MTGEAFEMRLKLARLSARHGVHTPEQRAIPLSAPTDHAIVEGYAGTPDIDADKTRFRVSDFPLAADAAALSQARRIQTGWRDSRSRIRRPWRAQGSRRRRLSYRAPAQCVLDRPAKSAGGVAASVVTSSIADGLLF